MRRRRPTPAATSPPARRYRVAYLGPSGTFSEAALLDDDELAACELVQVPTIAEAVEATWRGSVDAAFLPYENTRTGQVEPTRRALARRPELVMEARGTHRVHLCLLAPPGGSLADLERIVSHPQAFRQCAAYIADRLAHVRLEEAHSTAAAAREVAAAGGIGAGAIASARAAEVFGLRVLAGDIEDDSANATAFVLVRRLPQGS